MTIAAGNQVLASEIVTEHNTDWTHKVVLPLEHNANGTHKAAALASAGFPAGGILAYGGSAAPSGWLLCYGQAVSRTTYADLFTAISTAYGVGDGSTTFNMPDLRGRYGLGADNMGGSSANRVTDAEADTLGSGLGTETHTLTTAEMPAHTHLTSGAAGASGGVLNGSSNAPVSNPSASTGGGGAHKNMPPYQTVNYIIKT